MQSQLAYALTYNHSAIKLLPTVHESITELNNSSAYLKYIQSSVKIYVKTHIPTFTPIFTYSQYALISMNAFVYSCIYTNVRMHIKIYVFLFT